MPLVREGMRVTLENKGIVLEMWLWWGEKICGEDREEETTFLLPFTPPCLTVWLFLLSPLASSSLSRFNGTVPQILFSLLSVSQPPLTSFSGPIRLHRGVYQSVPHSRHGWCSLRYLRPPAVCLRISLCHPASFARLSRFPRSPSEPPARILLHLPVGWTVSRSRGHGLGEDPPCPRHW